MDDETLNMIFQTNVIGPIALVRELILLLLAERPARVVNIGSIFGDIPYPGFAAYSTSKFALRGFSTALRRACKANGIGVTYAAPRVHADRRGDRYGAARRRIQDASGLTRRSRVQDLGHR
jgi:NAD(P)-dependent dehydrogenase (short-subunit alcohol dehydrogenase family)